MWHTSVFTISYTDASYVGQLIGALALIVYFRPAAPRRIARPCGPAP